ncbi:glycosyltransferase family 2 protein [Verrucomicrobium spinosum]|uniref:glycosyltransferase family 2 protein n=1 Tax=Verrucomicrobium spinosum TaxID=2736 RepID=UPI0001744B55|nr:glycosyltransferase [Verrucomicrobium spinosum]
MRASVVIPTFNRSQSLTHCLDHLSREMALRQDCEVLVVDDGSQDDTAAVCRSRQNVILVQQSNQGAGAARNHGARLARGHCILFLDDDCLARPGWFDEMLRTCEADDRSLVGGQVVNALVHNPFAEASQTLLDYVDRYYNPAGAGARFVTSSNLALARHRFWETGGFDPSYAGMGAEDRDFCSRWLAGGGKIHVARQAVVDHAHHMDLLGFCRQHYAYGKGARQFHRAKQGPARGLEPAGYYAGMLTHPLLSPGGWRGLRLSLLIILSQIMSTVGYAWQGRGRNA